MYYYSKNSRKRVIHTRECSYIQNTAWRNIQFFKNIPKATKKGYCFCRRCSIIMQQYKEEYQKIQDFCKLNQLSVCPENNTILISSDVSEWKIVVDKTNRMVLYHKNYYETSKDHLSDFLGYHLQKDVCVNSIIGYMDYIVRHDKYRIIDSQKKEDAVIRIPRKGSRKYNNLQKKIKEENRQQAIINVLNLIDTLKSNADYRSY